MSASLIALLEHVTVYSKLALAKALPGVKAGSGIVVDDSVTVPGMATGLLPEREIPVLNKIQSMALISIAIMAPVLVIIAYTFPILNFALLAFGGWFLAKEGFEKLPESLKLLKGWLDNLRGIPQRVETKDGEAFLAQPSSGFVNALNWLEKHTPGFTGIPAYMRWLKTGEPHELEKVASGSTIQLPLTAEILIIALSSIGLVSGDSALVVIGATSALLAFSAGIVILGVYFIARRVVKIDDLGLALTQLPGEDAGTRRKQKFGAFLLTATPHFLNFLKVAATIVLLNVGGEAALHGIEGMAEGVHAEDFAHKVKDFSHSGLAATLGFGLLIGGLTFVVEKALHKGAH
jgi:predicted DNA repair protein MutK